jgi:hypothetical protein
MTVMLLGAALTGLGLVRRYVKFPEESKKGKNKEDTYENY